MQPDCNCLAAKARESSVLISQLSPVVLTRTRRMHGASAGELGRLKNHRPTILDGRPIAPGYQRELAFMGGTLSVVAQQALRLAVDWEATGFNHGAATGVIVSQTNCSTCHHELLAKVNVRLAWYFLKVSSCGAPVPGRKKQSPGQTGKGQTQRARESAKGERPYPKRPKGFAFPLIAADGEASALL